MDTIFKKYRQSIIGFLFLCCLWGFGPLSLEPNITFGYSNSDENAESLLIGIPRDITRLEAESILQDANLGELTVTKAWPEFGIALVKIPERSIGSVTAANTGSMTDVEIYRQMLEEIPAIGYAEYNYLISTPTISDKADESIDEDFSEINQLPSRSPSDSTNNQEVVVALIDSGFGTDEIDPRNYPLWENEAEVDGIAGVDDDGNGFIDDFHGWDWVHNDNVMQDPSGQGTRIGKAIVDLAEQASVNRNAVQLMPLQIFNEEGKARMEDLVDALAYAIRKDVRIANLNLISFYNSPSLRRVIQMAHEEELLLIAPSMVRCRAQEYWPASYDEVLGVTYFINVEIRGLICPMRYQADLVILIRPDDLSQTNLALQSLPVPYATGLAALILLDDPDLSNIDIKTALLNLADYASEGPLSTVPILDIQKNIQERVAPTALIETIEPKECKHFLPLIVK